MKRRLQDKSLWALSGVKGDHDLHDVRAPLANAHAIVLVFVDIRFLACDVSAGIGDTIVAERHQH